MKHLDKSKKELIDELEKMHQKYDAIIELHKQEALERKQTEKALRNSESKFRALFEQSGGYCMVLDPNTEDGIPIIVDANNAACKMHGYSREEFIGRPVADIDNEDGKKLVKERTALIMTGKPFYVENIHQRKDGTFFTVAVNAKRIDIEGEPPLIFTVEYDITNRVEAEKALRKSKEALELTEHIAELGGWSLDLSTMTSYLSKETIGLYELDSPRKPTLEEGLEFYTPEDRPKIEAAFQECIATGKPYDLELRFVTEKGNKRWVRAVGKAEIINGKVVRLSGFLQNITEKKKAEEALKQSEASVSNKLKAISEPEGDIGTLELSDIIDTEILTSLMNDFYKLTGILGAVLDISGKVLISVGWQDICTKFHRCNPDSLQNCIESDTILTKGVPEGTFKSYHCKNNMWDIVTPIVVGGKHLGNVFIGQYFLEDELPDYDFFRKQAQKYGFDEAAYLEALDQVPRFSKKTVETGMHFYSKLAGIISTLSYSTVQQSRMLSERKKAEEKIIKAKIQIEESEEKYRLIFERDTDAIFIYNPETARIIEANKATSALYGYTGEELIGKSVMELSAEKEASSAQLHKMKMDGQIQVPIRRHKKKDGSVIYVDVKGFKIRLQGKDVMFVITKNISDKVLAEEALKKQNHEYEALNKELSKINRDLIEAKEKAEESERKLRIVTDNLPVLISQIDSELKYLFANQYYYNRSLFQSGIIGKNMIDVMGEKTFNRALPHIQKVLQGEIVSFENRTSHTKNNELVIFETHYIPHIVNGQVDSFFVLGMDITDRKLAEEKTRAAEENLKNTFDLSPSIICKGDVNTGYFIEASQAVTRILGYSVEEFTSKPFVEFVHPDDRQSTIDEMSELQAGKEMAFFDNRYLCKDGSYKWMTWHGSKVDKYGMVTAIASDITDRKQNEENTKKSQSLLQQAEEISNQGAWEWDIGKDEWTFSENWLRIHGCQLTGIKREELMKIAYSEDAPGIEIAFQDALKGIARYDLEHRIVRKNDGKVRNVKAIGDFIFNESGTRVKMYGVTKDITDKKRAESEVRRLSTAVKQSPSVIVITDAKGKLEYVNPKFTELTGYSSSESIGKESNILKSGEQNAAFYKEMWEKLESGKVWRGQFHNKKKNGELFWEAASISAILNESGEVVNFIKIGEDITQQKNTEAELKAALGKAMESDRLKSAFLANMSHEIRTPMNGILGFASLLKEPDLTGEKQQEYIGIIEKGGARMLNIINDIISISMIESGQMKLSIQESNIHHQIEYIYNFFKLEVEEKGIRFSFNSPLSVQEASIKTDREKVFAILTNLVKNAIKYTDSGSIDFGFHKKGNYLEFYVKDTGIGIPKDRQNAIFERFIQADIEDAMAKQGAGLGLAISKAYVENLGGKIWVESEEGKVGSTFYFTLPYQTETTIETITDNSILDPVEVNAIRKLNILIVEDDEISEELITIIVEEFGKEIIVARTGKEAVDACRKNPDIDLVLMDIQLPEMNGYMATSNIRKFNKEVIIIAQTAYALEGDKEKAIAAGCDDYIQKPMNKEVLVQMIHTYFG